MKMFKKMIFTVFLFLLLVTGVSAKDPIPDYSGGGHNPGLDNVTGNFWPTSYHVGIRITFMTVDGQKLGNSFDFFLKDTFEGYKNVTVKYSPGRCNKANYANGKCSLPLVGELASAKFSDIAYSSETLENMFKSGFSTISQKSLNLRSALINHNFTALFDGILKENTNSTQEQYDKILDAFLGQLYSGDIKDLFGEDSPYKDKVFLVMEPTAMFAMKRSATSGYEYYYGTSYELANWTSQVKPGTYVYNKETGATCSDALCDFGTPMRITIPCSTYLDGSLEGKIQSLNKNGKYDAVLAGIKSNQYFYKIDIISNAASICSNSRFSADDVTGNSGVGIGVIWLGSLGRSENNKLTCQIAEKGMNVSKINQLIRTYYNNERVGLDGFYTLYSQGIPYTKPDGKQGTADAKWYVNECTCYGMYDYFDKQYTPGWKSQSETLIKNFESNLGPNWFDRLNDVKMSDLTIGRINTVLNSSPTFKGYNEALQNYVNELNSGKSDMLYPWTTANSSKYNTLGCESDKHPDVKTSCSDLQSWYNTNKPSNYVNLTSMTASDIRGRYRSQVSQMFQAYNIIYANATGTYWMIDQNTGVNRSYIALCLNNEPEPEPETPPTNYSCQPNKGVGICQNNGSIHYKDIGEDGLSDEYWNNCIFNDKGVYDDNNHKTSANGPLTYYEENLGDSEYCPVYCIEDVEASLRPGGFTVLAGSHFQWEGHRVSGHRTCKAEVNYDQFKKDLNAANDAVVDAYVQWQLALKYQDSLNNARTITNGCSYRSYDTVYSYCSVKDGIVDCDNDCSGKCNSSPQELGYDGCGSGRRVSRTDTLEVWSVRCYVDYYEDKHVYNSVSFSVDSTYGTKKSDSISGGSWCGSSKPSSGVSTKKATYDQAIRKVNGVVDRMKSCYTWNASDIYNLDPTLTVDYSSGLYSYTGDLEPVETESQRYYTLTGDIDDDCKNDSTAYKMSCSGAKCTTVSAGVNKCSYVSKTRRASVTFDIPSDVYQYVSKDTHQSSHNISSNINYVLVGTGNFPIAYNTPDGLYGVGSNKGKLDITYSKLGHLNAGETKTAVDTILGSYDSTNYGKWQCNYIVDSQLIPDRNNGGIRVIYRPIDLKDPFPDMDASGRKTGSNWCAQEDCSNTNKVVQDVVLNNRDVTGDSIYNQEPMYTFKLTPAKIIEIRKYNKDHGYDDFNLICEEGTGKKCISNYLTDMIQNLGATGLCATDKNGNVANRGDNFYGCRYPNR